MGTDTCWWPYGLLTQTNSPPVILRRQMQMSVGNADIRIPSYAQNLGQLSLSRMTNWS